MQYMILQLLKWRSKLETLPEEVISTYHQLVDEISSDIERLQREYGRGPCPSNCFQCCLNTSTIPISEVEARDLKTGLDALPEPIRQHIREKAQKTIKVLEDKGFSPDKMVQDAGMKAIDVIKGKSYGECPMLIGGVCSVYEHRPVICRVWGYPIDNGTELACCKKTFIGVRTNFKPIKYADYWRRCKELSLSLGAEEKTPNCYLVLELLDD